MLKPFVSVCFLGCPIYHAAALPNSPALPWLPAKLRSSGRACRQGLAAQRLTGNSIPHTRARGAAVFWGSQEGSDPFSINLKDVCTAKSCNSAHKGFRKRFAPVFLVAHRERTPAAGSGAGPQLAPWPPTAHGWTRAGDTGPAAASIPGTRTRVHERNFPVPLSCQSIAKALGRVNNRIAAN